MDNIEVVIGILKSGKRCIVSDETLDAIIERDGDFAATIRSAHNRNRVGIRDQYVAWVSDAAKPADLSLNPTTMQASASL